MTDRQPPSNHRPKNTVVLRLVDEQRTVLNRAIVVGVVIGILGIAQFLFCTSHAMSIYAGGNIVTQSEPGYDWQKNWLSDLGRHTSWSKQNNRASAFYFNNSIIILGISLGCFFALFALSVEEWDAPTLTLQTSGLISCFGLIWIGLTPFDLYHNQHLCGLALWILPMPIMATIFAMQCLRTAGAVGWIAGVISIAIGALLIFAIGLYAQAGSPTGYVVMQKIVVGIAIVWFIMICARVGLSAVETVTLSRKERIAIQIDQYASKLKKRHRRVES